jgi:hypothetical protein
MIKSMKFDCGTEVKLSNVTEEEVVLEVIATGRGPGLFSARTRAHGDWENASRMQIVIASDNLAYLAQFLLSLDRV